MIPSSRLSALANPAAFLGARNTGDIGPVPPVPGGIVWRDREDGGIALQDASQGLLSTAWLGTTDGTAVVLEAPSVAPAVLITGVGISEISFSFDRLMNPVIAYVEGGSTKLRWFDVGVNGIVTTVYGAGYLHPRVSLDDKHPLASETSDVIFAYLRDGDLRYRQQRDRYEIERVLATAAELLAAGITQPLRKAGMSTRGHFQFAFGAL